MKSTLTTITLMLASFLPLVAQQFTVSSQSVRPGCPYFSPGYQPNGSFTVSVVNASGCTGTYTVAASPVAGSGPGGSTPPVTQTAAFVAFGAGNFFFNRAGAGTYNVTVTHTGGTCSPPVNPVVIAVVVPDASDESPPVFYVRDILGNILIDNDPATPQTTSFNFGTSVLPGVACNQQDTYIASGQDNCDGFITDFSAVTASVITTPFSIVPGTQVNIVPDGFGNYTIIVNWSVGTSTVSINGRDASGNLTPGLNLTRTILKTTPPSITCPDTQTLELGAGCFALVPNYTGLISIGTSCGITVPPANITQNPAPGTAVTGSGSFLVTMTITDIFGNFNSCSFIVNKVGGSPPVAVCSDQTVTFNGEAGIALDPNDLVTVSGGCGGIQSITLSTENIGCIQLGQVLPVTATVTDLANNTATCTSQITVAGLPCGWSSTSGSVGCASSVSYAPATSVWDLTATNCYNASPFTSDAMAFAQRTLCGDGSITTQVNAIAGAAGWAGVIMRESNAPGAKKVQLTTNRINFRRREFRINTDGPAQSQQTPSQNRFWLRIERQGNQFKYYTSSNGVSWNPAGVSNISMGACIEIGLVVVNSSPNSTTSATFSNVSHTSTSSPLQAPVASPTPEEGLEIPGFHVFPNPTTGEINIELTPYAGRGVRIEVLSLQGQLLKEMEIDEVNHPLERLDLSSFKNGMYLIRVKTPGMADAAQRIILTSM
jgi:hypothetical protein